MHRGNNWGYREGEREGVNAQGKQLGLELTWVKGSNLHLADSFNNLSS